MIRVTLRDLRLVDRAALILDACRDKRVLHLGATDAPETEGAIRDGRFLHSQLGKVSAHLVGLDNNRGMIEFLANRHGVTNIRYGDIERVADYPDDRFDVIVAGEIMEHLNNPGLALSALRKVLQANARMVVTVPNAYALKGFVRALMGHEWIHPDHVVHHSLRTLTRLLSRHGFVVESTFSFVNGGAGILARAANIVIKVFPQLAEGIGVVCRFDGAENPD